MIQQKEKICSGCKKSKRIWKNIDGKGFCKSCTFIIQPPKQLKVKAARPISHRSQKRIQADKQYTKVRKQFLLEHPCCEAGKHGLHLPECKGSNPEYLTIQHLKGRVGKLYLDTRYWITLCLFCHSWVNENPDKSIEMGLAQSRLKKDDL